MPLPESVGKPAYRLYQLAWSALDWIYPPHCGGCGTPGARWCETCAFRVQLITGPLCPDCGQPQPAKKSCSRCSVNRPAWRAARSWAAYGDSLANAIKRLKYGGDIALGEILAAPLIPFLATLNWPVDIITPVPVGLARREERGYNQASLLGRPIALGSGIPYRPNLLTKQKETRSQVGLSFADRQRNVAGAYTATREHALDKYVLVVDDVMTSGATLEACTQALLEAGAAAVYCLTLARAGMMQT